MLFQVNGQNRNVTVCERARALSSRTASPAALSACRSEFGVFTSSLVNRREVWCMCVRVKTCAGIYCIHLRTKSGFFFFPWESRLFLTQFSELLHCSRNSCSAVSNWSQLTISTFYAAFFLSPPDTTDGLMRWLVTLLQGWWSGVMILEAARWRQTSYKKNLGHRLETSSTIQYCFTTLHPPITTWYSSRIHAHSVSQVTFVGPVPRLCHLVQWKRTEKHSLPCN